MFDALSIFHLKVRRLAFQVLPVLRSLQLSLGIQLSGGQQSFWKCHQSTQQSVFSSLTLRDPTQMQEECQGRIRELAARFRRNEAMAVNSIDSLLQAKVCLSGD